MKERNEAKYSLGVDFGTLSARAVLIEVHTGRELGAYVHDYEHGIISERLPGTQTELPHGFALQSPQDYLDALKITVQGVMEQTKAPQENIVGIGVSFTSCTVLPVMEDGTPLNAHPDFQHNPYAWVQLWKHHEAQEEAAEMTKQAEQTGAVSLDQYGGQVSAQWVFPKALRMLRKAPDVYRAADRIIEAGDWIVWQLTGEECRSATLAGYKAFWRPETGYPDSSFFKTFDPEFATVVEDKIASPLGSAGSQAGTLSEAMAKELGLQPGTPVAVANIDAHAAVPGAGVVEGNRLVLVMGTSICHMILAERELPVQGICGVVEDGIAPALYAYEAGQPALGDLFAWHIDHYVPHEYHVAAEKQGVSLFEYVEQKAANLPNGSGLLALDWWNGNRSVLDNADLTGLIVGYTLETRPEHVYLALMESLAYGTATVIESFERSGVQVDELVASGGVPRRSPLLMQVFADVTGRPIEVAASKQATALGSAMYGAVAAGSKRGGHDNLSTAAQAMVAEPIQRYTPDAQRHAMYQRMYAEYKKLHDYFGKENSDLMRRLRERSF